MIIAILALSALFIGRLRFERIDSETRKQLTPAQRKLLERYADGV